MGIKTLSGETKTYLYLMGVKPEKPIKLSEHLYVEPTVCNPNPNDMINAIMNKETGSCREEDLGILIATLRHTTAQLRIEAPGTEDLAIRAWNAQTDVTLLSALIGKEIYWHIQSDVGANHFAECNFANIVVNSRLYIPQNTHLISVSECEALETLFSKATKLMDEKRFYSAVNSLWSHRINLNPYVQMATLWAGIESLLGVGNCELAHRVSTTSALFLEAGKDGKKQTKKLYNARSKAVHEGLVKDYANVIDSASLLRALILKCVEVEALPEEDDLIFSRSPSASNASH